MRIDPPANSRAMPFGAGRPADRPSSRVAGGRDPDVSPPRRTAQVLSARLARHARRRARGRAAVVARAGIRAAQSELRYPPRFPNTRTAGRCPADFCASSAGSRFHFGNLGGAKEGRTPDLLNAIQTLYQLSYSPMARLTAVESSKSPPASQARFFLPSVPRAGPPPQGNARVTTGRGCARLRAVRDTPPRDHTNP